MSELELKSGRVYRAKKPRDARGFFNDRQVVYISHFQVQYDSPSISMGRKLPMMDKEKFLKWIGEDITDKLPDGEWEVWSR